MSRTEKFDVIVTGAGFAGMYALYRFRQRGLSVRVIEAGDDVGGTWYWNRYPGARCDVPTIEYSYSFSKALENEWDWREIMSGQPEILEYANHVADRFDLRKDIRFNTRVLSATWQDERQEWVIETDAGERYLATWCVMATGCLSVPLFPTIQGEGSFEGPTVHTGLWPKEGVDLAGKRVGIIGTGSSGVQAIPEVVAEAEHLYVFQRTPVYTLPANNRPLDPEFREAVKEHYDEIREIQRHSPIGISGWNLRHGQAAGVGQTERVKQLLDLTEAEREQVLEKYGFASLGAYADIRTDHRANAVAREMYRKQVHKVIDDEALADKLSPSDYPLGCKRQVFDTGYYEAFNRDNITLVDLHEEAIEAITPTGVRTDAADYGLDVLIYATGFDAMTGALNRIDIRGRDGMRLKDKWATGPRAYLGIQSAGFPNLFTITGPGSPSVLSNMLVSIEQHVEWVDACIDYLQSHGLRAIEPQEDAELAWCEHVNEVAQGTMFTAPSCNSWYLGANVPGKPRQFMPYVGGVGRYREKCDEVVANGYEGFVLSQ